MSKLDELDRLADAARPFTETTTCEEVFAYDYDSDEHYARVEANQRYGIAANPQTIKQMIALIREMECALKQWVKCCELSGGIRTEVAVPLRALQKLKEFEV